jgi:hypothetical protein
LQERFGLEGFEIDTLLVCLAPLIERRFERLFAYLNDDLSRPFASVDLLLRLLAPRRDRLFLSDSLDIDAPLIRWGLLAYETAGQRSGRLDIFRLPDGVARFILGRANIDPVASAVRLDDDVAPLAWQLWQNHSPATPLAERLYSENAGSAPLVINLHGRNGSGRTHSVWAACETVGKSVIAIDGHKLRRIPEWPTSLTAALREAHLHGHVLFLHHADALLNDPERHTEVRTLMQAWLRELGGTLLLGSDEALSLGFWFPAATISEIALPTPPITVRESAWREALATLPGMTEPEIVPLAEALAGKFKLTLGEIASATQLAHSAGSTNPASQSWAALVHNIVSQVAAPRLHQLAESMPTSHRLEDVVLPAEKHDLLHDLVRRVKHRRTVLESWGFDAVSTRGHGLVALFHGASGTGKTMAADAIANTLQMQLFRIDLAGVVSKYIGETEKNLRTIFDEAARADAVLFFDEADALFGKRSEVKDAHDRYANIEINYLLQRIELFDGIAILATNKRNHIDDAFMRRIHVTIEFPMPREPERLRLWDRSFPVSAPLSNDVDWPFLAKQFELSGGTIRNAALGAAYLAAEQSPVIGMRQIVNALRSELVKAGRRPQDSEFGPHAPLLIQPNATPDPFAPRLRRATLED